MATAASWVCAMLLAVAGAGKVARPAPTAAALRSARLPAARLLIRAIGAGEIALGAAALLAGGWVPAAGLALAYLAFAAVARRQQHAGADCGCFGSDGAPVTGLHVMVDLGAAAIALVAAAAPGPSLSSTVVDDPVTGIVAAMLAAVAAATLRLLLTAAPDLYAAMALIEPDGAA